jgi:NAD(P)-dependent dehydrogenase (short-subunit alcohol dehydrogenase family)
MIYLVTGSNRGLGLELIRCGARLGHELVASCRSESRELSALAEEFPKVHILKMDVADTGSVEKAARETAERYKYLNGFINNAAVLYGSKYDTRDAITTIDIAETENTMNINVIGVVRVMKFFMPLVYAAPKGERCIMNISSEGAILKDSGHQYASYGASKCALNGYSQRMRNYLASQPDKEDIRMYMIHPGRMDTVMGKENAQIQPAESAEGLWAMLDRRVDVYSSIPFFDYHGNLMLKQ